MSLPGPGPVPGLERDYDIVVIGYGGAGASAAIEAHDRGAQVLVVEKMAEGGGNTRDSGGSLRRLDDREGALEHFLALSQGSTPRELLETFADGVDPMLAWLEEIGGAVDPWTGIGGFPKGRHNSAYPALPGADAMGARLKVRSEGPGIGGGQALWDVLHRAITERSIPVWCGTAATRLIRDASGAISGVTVRRGADTWSVNAIGGVVLACGGFSYDEDLQRQFLGLVMPSFGPPAANSGDGIRLAQDVGAGLWHMQAAAAVFGYQVEGRVAAYQHRMPSAGYIYVDRHGRRYVNEAGFDNHSITKIVLHFDPIRVEYPRIPTLVVFDETTRQSGPVCHVLGGYNRRFRWSNDNLAEIERGWIKRADTIAGLAEQCGVPQDALVETMERYNQSCRDGVDPEFGRSPDGLVPIEHAPFYGIEARPCLLNTQGGPRRDTQARVLDAFGAPIPGLYAAGELGSIWSALYPGGGNVSEALIFGRIAGREAAERAR